MDQISMTVLKRATEMEHIAEILFIGEQLRLRLHEDKLIKDRRRNLSSYPNCFVAREVIDWLIDRKEAADRPIAIELMQRMIDESHIHHACDEFKVFKDAKLYYRFRRDDGTCELDLDVKCIQRGQRIYEKLMNCENFVVQAREEDGVKYERSFMGSEFVDLMILIQESRTRNDAVQLSRRLLEHAVIQHVTNKYHFVDGTPLYQFRINFRRRRRLMELLTKRPQVIPESQDSPFCPRKQSFDKSASFNSASEVKVIPAVRRSSMGSSAYFSSGPAIRYVPPIVLCNPKLVIEDPVTAEELTAPGAPYSRRTLTIVSDAVGWGFVVRGEKPCFIQCVDPTGPAASSGVKACQYVVSVNGLSVLNCTFRAVSNLILTGPRTIVLEVMEEVSPSKK